MLTVLIVERTFLFIELILYFDCKFYAQSHECQPTNIKPINANPTNTHAHECQPQENTKLTNTKSTNADPQEYQTHEH